MKRFLNFLLQKIQKDPAARFDPALSVGEIFGVFAVMGGCLWRGLHLRPRLRRARGFQFLHRGAVVRDPKYLVLGRNVVAESHCEIQGRSRRGVELGDGVTVGRYAMIRPSGYYGRELGEGLRIGPRSNVGPYCYLGCAGYIDIGADVLMGPRVGLFAENHVFDDPARPIREQGVTRRGIVIEDDCWLGTGTVILDGVRVGRGSVVAAGSVVTRDVPPGMIAAGSPARVVKKRGGGKTDRGA